jgi:hypothetical protein
LGKSLTFRLKNYLLDSPVGVEARFFVKIALFRCSFWQGFPGQSLQKMSIALAAIEQGWVALAEGLFYIVQIIVKEKIPIKK